MLAIVQEVLDEPRSQLALGIGAGEELEVVGVRLVLATPPVPPAIGGQLEPSGLILVVLLDILADVLHDHGELVVLALFLERDAEHGQTVDREIGAVAVEEVAHLGVVGVGIDEDHVDQCVEVIGGGLPRLLLGIGQGVVEFLDLLFLVAFEPGDTAVEHAGNEGNIVLLSDLQAVDDQGGGVRRGVLSPKPENQPQPPSESCISVRALTPSWTMRRTSA